MIGNQSNKADAKCHRERKSSNEVFEFLEKKLYLGRDTRQKLALIARKLTGSGFSPDKFDAEKAADVLSACVNHMFNDLLNGGELNGIYGLEEHPVIVPGRSPKALEIYTVYQLVKGRFDKLQTGESDREKCASVAAKLNECGPGKPLFKHFSDSEQWTREDVAWVLQPENINALINVQNKKYARLSAEDKTKAASGNGSKAKNT
ncbi:hypothetical protein [Citrobacter farmeri]|uniref:hypothetical protein n=1 Tax=Citrobacter farmeri TaxID=67824 RepID=UPI00189D47BC|nr:hypothetical protein [Citrobacter farmeri]EHK0944828.1 hypothetical protein [Citrobacter farmeri]EKX4540831.1 hypothetical protein [Citrobacter farmeri]MDB2163119.1 hypothetical protein [Citrobacter farmeri]HBC0355355.1 hypothetical protein [Citrobacter farmeri]HBZ8833736.1 hypothetical protein [Citrobacter farmeri]